MGTPEASSFSGSGAAPMQSGGGGAGRPRICVVGSINMDLVVRVSKLPTAGATVLGSSYKTYSGGKGANQAVAAARLGADVVLIGSIGDDPHGRELLKTLQAEKLDLSTLLVREGRTSGLAMITVAEGGENTIVVAPGANALLTADDVRAASGVIESCDALLMQLETPTQAVMVAAQIAREAGKPVLLNAAPARALSPELFKLIDVLIVNRVEAATLSGLDANIEPARLALRLADGGVPTIVLTLGAQGAMITHRRRPKRIGAVHVKQTDSVGAGDAFAGALAVSWPPVYAAAKAKSPEEFRLVDAALELASAAGALATTKPGAIPALPTRAEVDALLNSARPSEITLPGSR
ncbi:MAG: ribokinase [Planctomycetota bacterium]|nr:ribokinase [Planctomycetota bacterium]